MDEIKKIEHLGLILDGNRRWARAKGLHTLEGHKQGYQVMKNVGQWCLDRGIKVLTAFAFSTENWKRSKEEVGYLMDLLAMFLKKDVKDLHEKGIRLKVIGRKQGFSSLMIKLIDRAEKMTEKNDKALFQLAMNYGGRSEIVDAVKNIVEQEISTDVIDEKTISQNIYTADVKDPDLIIRTSGEQRLSGFLLWQAAYSELLFLDKNWPDFTEQDLDQAIQEYSRRQRRYGQ